VTSAAGQDNSLYLLSEDQVETSYLSIAISPSTITTFLQTAAIVALAADPAKALQRNLMAPDSIQ
jgi:hypothetical protein